MFRINISTYFRQHNAIVACLFYHQESDCCIHHPYVQWIRELSALAHKKRLRWVQPFFFESSIKIFLWSAFLEFAGCSELWLGLGFYYQTSIPVQDWLEHWTAVGKWSIFVLLLANLLLILLRDFTLLGEWDGKPVQNWNVVLLARLSIDWLSASTVKEKH